MLQPDPRLIAGRSATRVIARGLTMRARKWSAADSSPAATGARTVCDLQTHDRVPITYACSRAEWRFQAGDRDASASQSRVEPRRRSADADLRARPQILFVDDDPTVCRLVRDLLRSANYDCAIAHSGAEALAILAAGGHGIDLLVSDLTMPGMSGFELADRVRTAAPDLKVLFVSGYTDQQSVAATKGIDASRFIAKPFRFSELRAKIDSLLAC